MAARRQERTSRSRSISTAKHPIGRASAAKCMGLACASATGAQAAEVEGPYAADPPPEVVVPAVGRNPMRFTHGHIPGWCAGFDAGRRHSAANHDRVPVWVGGCRLRRKHRLADRQPPVLGQQLGRFETQRLVTGIARGDPGLLQYVTHVPSVLGQKLCTMNLRFLRTAVSVSDLRQRRPFSSRMPSFPRTNWSS